MTQARKVKPGQVWTAKVSGKNTQVEIVGETTASAGGRTRFLWKNLNTGRTSAGGAGKLHDLVRDASAAAPAPAPAPARPAPAPPRTTTRRPPPRQARQGFGSPPSRPAQQDERRAAVSALGWKPEAGSADERYAATTGEMLAWSRERPVGPPSLPSLRSTPSSRTPPARTNPKHYPSTAAKAAAEVISRSNAQTPHEAAQVVAAWAASFAPGSWPTASYVAPPPGYGAPPGFNPYQPRPF